MTRLPHRHHPMIAGALAGVLVLGLGACAPDTAFHQPSGSELELGEFGTSTAHNTMVMTGRIEATQALQQRFANEVPDSVTFAFASADLTPEAMAVLARQAAWIRQFPELRFRVYGHTDLVGSNAANKALGMRRARAVVAYLQSQGIGSARLEAVISYGKTRPVVAVPGPEERNRRTVTEVQGFTQGAAAGLNGKYASVVWREFVEESAKSTHPDSSAGQGGAGAAPGG